MELRQIRYFAETARELHFARAAANLNVTQPALSRQIASLEKELGVLLFSRENKWKIELTPAGRLFLTEAEKILHESSSAVNLVKSAAMGGYGKLSIGAISSTISKPAFCGALHELRTLYPSLILEIVDATSVGLPEMVRQHTLDIAFLRSFQTLPYDDSLICEPLWNDKLIAALPIRHPLAKQDRIAVGALKNESFIMVPERTSSFLNQYLIQFFQRYGRFTPHVNLEIYNTFTALRMVSAELGVTIVSESYLGTFAESVRYQYFSDHTPEVPLFVIRASDHFSRNAGLFLSILKKKLSAGNRGHRNRTDRSEPDL